MKMIKATESYQCTWCKAAGKKVPAVWRLKGLGGISKKACEEHREDLREYEKKLQAQDQHMSEADYQTWGRL